MAKPLIVGVDIGTTTGLAIFDLDKNLLYTGSKREFSTSKIIKEIMNFGNPLIVATDKNKVPSKIKKIAAAFSCKVFQPDHDLSVEEKDEIIRIPIKDSHEKDALASASFAFRKYEALFNTINRTLNQLSLEQHKDRVKEMIITGNAKNIAEAIEKIRPKEVAKEDVNVRTRVREINLNWKDKAKEKDRKLKDKDRRYDILEIYTERLEEKMKALERQKQNYLEEEMKKNEEVRKELMKDKEMKKREIIIKQLNFELAKQRNIKEIYEDKLKKQQELLDIREEGFIPVIKITEFDRKAIDNANKKFDIVNNVVWIENFKPSKLASRFLIKNKPKVIISDMGNDTRRLLKKYGIIVVDSIKPEMREFFGAVPQKDLETTMLKTEKRDFLKWLDDYKRR